MRKIIYLLALLALSAISLSAFSPADQDQSAVFDDTANKNILLGETTGWIDKGRYKEFKAHTDGVPSLRVTEDGKRIISVFRNEYKIWDFETGNLIKEYSFPSNNFYSLRILDDSTVIAIYFFITKINYSDYYSSFKVEAKIMNVFNENIIAQLIPYYEGFDLPTLSLSSRYFDVKYGLDKNMIYFSMIYVAESGGHTNRAESYKGGFKLFELKKDTSILIAKSQVLASLFSFLDDSRLILISNTYGAYGNRSGMKNYSSTTSLRISNKDLSSNQVLDSFYISGPNPHETFIYNYYVLRSQNSVVEVLDNGILRYISLDDFSVTDSCKIPFNTPSYNFALSENRIVFSTEKGIYIYSAPQMTPLDSFIFYRKDNRATITYLPDSVSFLVGSSDGYIRLFRSEALRGGPVSVKDPVENAISPIIFPNPAEDNIFLTKNDALLGTAIEIYSPTGIKVLEAPYAERIDVSELPAGMYFIKVGGKYGKFVKK